MPTDASSLLAIQNLIARYAEVVDDGDFAALGALMAHASFIYAGGEPVVGAAAVEALAHQTLQVHADGTPRTHHVTTNVQIELDDAAGVASAKAYFTVFQALDDFPLQPISAGRYRDRFTRIDGTWHFTAREVIPGLQGDRSRHVRTS